MQCLEDDTVVAWLSGSLAPDLGDVIEAHVDRCSACRSLLAALTDAPARCGESDRPWKQMPWAIGSVIDGLYRVERILGSGATSVVAAATRFADDQNVALKFMHPFERGSSRVTRFLEEARAAARLRGSHSCKILAVGELSSGRPYLVLEYLEGEDLRSLLRTRRSLPPSEACDLVLQACEALAEAHAQGIIHRDLKPANLFLARGRDGEAQLKVLDFGISKSVTRVGATLTQTGSFLGTPLYMAPEQLLQPEAVDGRADVWALGVVLHELVHGDTPFAGLALPRLVARILEGDIAIVDRSSAVGRIVARCLERDPRRRYGDIGELATALSRLVSRDASLLQIRAMLPAKKRRRWVAPAAIAVAALAAVAIGPGHLASRSQPAAHRAMEPAPAAVHSEIVSAEEVEAPIATPMALPHTTPAVRRAAPPRTVSKSTAKPHREDDRVFGSRL